MRKKRLLKTKEKNKNNKSINVNPSWEKSEKKINTPHSLFLSVHLNVYVCEGQTGTGQSVLIFLAGLSVSLQSVINLLRWSLFQKLSYTWEEKIFVAFINSQVDKNIQKRDNLSTQINPTVHIL